MTKSYLWILIFAALVLSACQASQPVSTATSAPALATSPASSPAGGEQGASGTAGSAAGGSPGCTVESPRPTPGPTQESIFPSVSASDWVQGKDTAYVTILEYSDFQ